MSDGVIVDPIALERIVTDLAKLSNDLEAKNTILIQFLQQVKASGWDDAKFQELSTSMTTKNKKLEPIKNALLVYKRLKEKEKTIIDGIGRLQIP